MKDNGSVGQRGKTILTEPKLECDITKVLAVSANYGVFAEETFGLWSEGSCVVKGAMSRVSL